MNIMIKDQIGRGIVIAIFAIAVSGPLQAKSKGGGGDHVSRGIELAEQKQYDAAIAEFTKAIQANASDPRNYTNRGTAYRAANRFAEAIADFT